MNTVKQRQTVQKSTILDVLRSTISHPNADWVFKEVRKTIPNISLGTVYRNLKSLTSDGYINEILTEKNVAHYDADMSTHSHFICKVCEHIIDLPEFDITGNYLQEHHFKTERINIEVYGVCPKCLQSGG